MSSQLPLDFRLLRVPLLIHTGSEQMIFWCCFKVLEIVRAIFSYLKYAEISLLIIRFNIEQVHTMNDKKSKFQSQEIQSLIKVCLSGHEIGKKAKQVMTNLFKKMKDCEQPKQKQDRVITIYIGSNANDKQSNSYNESFVMGCLLLIFIKFRYLKVNFVTSTKPLTKGRKNNTQIKMNLTQQYDIKLSQLFYQKIEALIHDSFLELKEASMHFKEISFQCQSQCIMNNETEDKKSELLKCRENTCEFIYNFYDILSEIFVNRKLFLVKNNLQLYCMKQNLGNSSNIELLMLGQEVYISKILKMQEKFYINIFIIKTTSQTFLKQYCQGQCGEYLIIQPQNTKENVDYQQKLGYMNLFQGNPFEFLSKLSLTFISPSQLNCIKKLLPKIPNINYLKINKQSQEIELPQINEFIEILIQYNKLIELFWFTKIRVTSISSVILQRLYGQCPYLTDFQINIRFRYLIQETYNIESPQDKLIKQNERQCQIILNALRLRRISLSHNIEMAKLLIKKDYNFNEIIEIVDCIQPFCI